MRIATVNRIIKTIAGMSGDEAITATNDLRDRLVAAFERKKELDGFVRSEGFGTPMVEPDHGPFIQVLYRKVISARYATELEIVVCRGRFMAFARTLHLTDGRGVDSISSVVAGDGQYETEVLFYCVEGMARVALQHALSQRLALMADLGFAVSDVTRKRVTKPVRTYGTVTL